MITQFTIILSSNRGRSNINHRICSGGLFINRIENLLNKFTIDYIQKHIYAQYFLGLPSLKAIPVFVPFLLVELRKRLCEYGAAQFIESLLSHGQRLFAIQYRIKSMNRK